MKRGLRNRRAAQKMEKKLEESRNIDRMEEEEESTEEMEEKPKSQSIEEMRSQLAPQTKDKVKMNYDLSLMIAERYKELLQELTTKDDSIEELGLTEEQKEVINKKAELWLEYFISTATFRDDDINLFDYMIKFCKTQKFI